MHRGSGAVCESASRAIVEVICLAVRALSLPPREVTTRQQERISSSVSEALGRVIRRKLEA